MDDEPWPAGLSAPARRALQAAGHTRLGDLAGASLVQTAALHGVGPKAIRLLADALAAAGTPFRDAEAGPRLWRAQARPGSTKWAGTGPARSRKAAEENAGENAGAAIELQVGQRTVRLSSPGRVYFPGAGWTKLDLVNYYLAVGDGILRATRDRPTMLHRFPKGLAGPKVYQKRLPSGAPDWVPTVRLDFPRYGLHADELAPHEVADLIWAVQMSTVEFHPWNVRASDVDRPDEWRIDLDPMPEADFDRVRRVAQVARSVLDELGIAGYPKTSGGSGLHIYVRIAPLWTFAEVRRAAWAFATEVVARIPQEATLTWWRKDRDPRHVFIDYNQNARDHTLAAAYSVRGLPTGTVSTPIFWDELDSVDPREFTMGTVPARFAEIGDPAAGIDDTAFSLQTLLGWAEKFDTGNAGPPQDGA